MIRHFTALALDYLLKNTKATDKTMCQTFQIYLKDLPTASLCRLYKAREASCEACTTEKSWYDYSVIKIIDALIGQKMEAIQKLEVAKIRAAITKNFKLFSSLNQDIRRIEYE